jgi:asparagine synthase (glutamine-hydrolysing)
MCGIAGFILPDQMTVDEHELVRMGLLMQHRGPDDSGMFIDGNVGLIHRRLSIIDLSTGHQPMANEDGRLQIIFNGEIYNYLELRQLLLGRGHSFSTSSDTEVIIHLYEDEGPACLDRLNGMFAFAIWDRRERTLFAARDRFGIKPFYYANQPGRFAFASEIKALFASAHQRPEMDHDGLADYLTFQFTLGDKTLFKGVRKLLPGHYLLLNSQGSLIIRKYWDLDFNVDVRHDEDYLENRLSRLLEDAIRLQLRADVPIGAHLSGGLDSSTVTCLASSLLGSPLHSFSGGFREGPLYDETGYARLAAESAGTIPHETFPTAQDFVDYLPRLIWHMDEPAAGPGLFPQYCVSKLARKHVKVVLGGQGGDEIFGGYVRYLIAYLEECLRGGVEGSQEERNYVVTFESILPNLTQLQGYQATLRYFWSDGLFDAKDRRYFRLIDRSADLRSCIMPELLRGCDGYDPQDAYSDIFNQGDLKSYINKMTRFDLKTLLPALLQVEDRTSMAVSLESRVPLLDHRIAELVAAMPPMIKYRGGRSKHIFRRITRHIVPAAILERKDKMGFPVPLNKWYKDGVVREFIEDILLGPRAEQRGMFQSGSLGSLCDSERPYGRGLWAVLCLELWMRTFLDGGGNQGLGA